MVRKCVKKMSKKTMKILKFHDFSKMIPDQLQSIFASKKQVFKAKTYDFQINGAKHSPSPLPLDRPSADFGRSRAGA